MVVVMESSGRFEMVAARSARKMTERFNACLVAWLLAHGPQPFFMRRSSRGLGTTAFNRTIAETFEALVTHQYDLLIRVDCPPWPPNLWIANSLEAKGRNSLAYSNANGSVGYPNLRHYDVEFSCGSTETGCMTVVRRNNHLPTYCRQWMFISLPRGTSRQPTTHDPRCNSTTASSSASACTSRIGSIPPILRSSCACNLCWLEPH